ncbi:hypothetical protein I5M27_13040 [Adhaeribacter sp. BT258]|uniref:SnoaL-like domain-containing protein n=1 Tax=Adhaeribacter terrigena TaxID=2793070 RepID=A0ABS1C3D7_9BACT|nr:hypothetical protein [Adhaeribacter terrigena]MBK0403914.1 hypothetical protein [Adhaeribacter terrigena]
MALFNRFFLAFFGLFLFSISSQAQTEFSRDQKALLKEALRIAVSDPNFLPEYPELVADKTVLLYDKMISMDYPDKEPVYLNEKQLPKFKNVKFELKTQSEIFDPARRQDMVFLRVMQINQPESEYALVTVLSQIALGSESREKGFLHKQSYGKTMLFKKDKKGWRFEKVANTLPNLVDYNLPY